MFKKLLRPTLCRLREQTDISEASPLFGNCYLLMARVCLQLIFHYSTWWFGRRPYKPAKGRSEELLEHEHLGRNITANVEETRTNLDLGLGYGLGVDMTAWQTSQSGSTDEKSAELRRRLSSRTDCDSNFWAF